MNVSLWLEFTPIERLDAELIIANILGKDRSFLHAHPDYNLKKSELAQAKAMADRRAQGEPLAYILGYKEFYGREFKVTKDTLIPRPETEALITEILHLKPQRIADIGTDSGCIAITLAKELPDTEITGVDISDKALEIAQENAQKHHANVNFYQSDLLSNLSQAAKYDLIVANLPYVDKDWDWLSGGLSYEPQRALYARDGGLELIKKLIDQAPDYLAPNGYLVLEADESQHQKIIKYTTRTGQYNLLKKADDNSALALVLQLR